MMEGYVSLRIISLPNEGNEESSHHFLQSYLTVVALTFTTATTSERNYAILPSQIIREVFLDLGW